MQLSCLPYILVSFLSANKKETAIFPLSKKLLIDFGKVERSAFAGQTLTSSPLSGLLRRFFLSLSLSLSLALSLSHSFSATTDTNTHPGTHTHIRRGTHTHAHWGTHTHTHANMRNDRKRRKSPPIQIFQNFLLCHNLWLFRNLLKSKTLKEWKSCFKHIKQQICLWFYTLDWSQWIQPVATKLPQQNCSILEMKLLSICWFIKGKVADT